MKYVYLCTRCGANVGCTKNKKKSCSYSDHLKSCWPNGTSGIDYIECALCEFAGLKITQHIKQVHNLSKDEYIKNYGPTICKASQKHYGDTGNYNWIRRAKERGEDVSEKFSASGKAKSAGILASSRAIEARRQNMINLNKRPERREKSSQTAKKTSSRPEIIEARTEALRKWRTNNFDDFYEKCVMPMIGACPTAEGEIRQTKPEQLLLELLKNRVDYIFKYSQCIKSNSFSTLSKRKQVDFGDKKAKVYIEFDGIHHFRNVMSSEVLEKTQSSDASLDKLIEKRGWTLIRISYDQFNGKKFLESCVKNLSLILDNPKPGVFRIGEAYTKEEK